MFQTLNPEVRCGSYRELSELGGSKVRDASQDPGMGDIYFQGLQ